MDIRVEKKELLAQLDFLIAAKLIHLVSDVVFETLYVFLVVLSSKQLRQIIMKLGAEKVDICLHAHFFLFRCLLVLIHFQQRKREHPSLPIQALLLSVLP